MVVLQFSIFTPGFVLYILFCLLVIPLGLTICIKLNINVKNEEHNDKGKVIQRIIKTYSMVQCVAWPLILLLALLVMVANRTHFSESHPSLMDTVKSITRFFFNLTCSYVGFNSLVIAICRYVFIVWVTHNESFTIKRLRNVFVTASIMVPIAVAILQEATFPKHESLGKVHAPDIDTSDNNTSTNLAFRDTMNNTTSNTTNGIVPQSFVFIFVDTYFPTVIKTAMIIVNSFMKFAIFSNILEGLIYLHIYFYDRKSENQVVVSDFLSERVRMRRQRRTAINIQMTIISWLIEFITGLTILAMHFLYKEAGIFNKANIPKEAIILICFAMFNIFVNFVMIPGTYILNTDACKQFVIEHGWITALRRRCHSTRVYPLQNEDQNSDNHHNDVHRPKSMPQHIPSISANISARKQGNQRQNTNIEMKTLG